MARRLNKWQEISASTHDVVTPANVIDAFGFAGSMYGVSKLDTWRGIFTSAVSYMTDFADGKVARATKTTSELGETLDAAGDKVKLAAGLRAMWQKEMAPRPLLKGVAVQNTCNALLAIIDRLKNKKPVMHSSLYGKRAIFFQQWGLGLHVIGHKLKRSNSKSSNVIKNTGTVVTLVGLGLGIAATIDYANTLAKSRSR